MAETESAFTTVNGDIVHEMTINAEELAERLENASLTIESTHDKVDENASLTFESTYQLPDTPDTPDSPTAAVYEFLRETSADLSTKVALIIGPVSGIGEAFGAALLRKQAKVIFMNVKDENFTKLIHNFHNTFNNDHIKVIECNIFDESSLEGGLKDAVKAFGELDYIINTLSYIDSTNWRKVVDVNLTFAITLTELVLEHFGKDNGGNGITLVQTSSYVGLYPVGSFPVYSAAKAALVHYVRSYGRREVYDIHGVNMFCICPAMVGRVFNQEKAQNTLLDPGVVGRCLTDLLESNKNMYGAVIKLSTETPQYLWQNK